MGKETVPPKEQKIKGTGTFKVIRFNHIPFDKQKGICHTRVVCEYCLDKYDPNRMRITIVEWHILFPFDVSTPNGPLQLVNIMINIILSRPNAQSSAFDIKNSYLDMPMEKPEYVRVKLEDIPQEFIDEYNLLENERHRWDYFEIVRGCYGLPHSEKWLMTRLKRDWGMHTTMKQPQLRACGIKNGAPYIFCS